MKKSRFTDQQIAFALQQAENGTLFKRCAGRWASATHRRLLESIRTVGSAKAKLGANATESQDFLYDGRGLP